MLTSRDKHLIGGSLLMGIGVGSIAGLCLFVASVFLLLHHMFIMGVNWIGMIVLTGVPLALVLCGALILLRAKGTHA